jgi:hypothetical protein
MVEVAAVDLASFFRCFVRGNGGAAMSAAAEVRPALMGYLKQTNVQGLFKYQIDWTQVRPNGGYIFYGGAGPVKPLLNRNNQQLAIPGMQGGVFNKGQGGTTSDGSILFITNSDHGSRDGHGIWAFLKSTGELIGESSSD